MEKKRLWIYIAIAYGITAIMSIGMYVAHRQTIDTTAFVNVQMMYPACGVILGKLIFKDDEKKLPVAGYVSVLVTTAVLMIMAILSVVFPLDPIETGIPEAQIDIWNTASQVPLICGSIVAYILFWVCGKEKRENAGLERKNLKLSAVFVALFILLLVGRIMLSVFISDAVKGTDESWSMVLAALQSPMTWVTFAILPINFILSFIAFFGEEYGWRYYLQPLMQNRFGKRSGILLLALVWAIWHINVDFMYYTDGYGMQAFISQIITCIAASIFFGYAYMKTENIMVPIIMHYLNNNLTVLLSGRGADALKDQVINWGDIPIHAASYIIFFLFILAPVYKNTSDAKESAA